MHSQLRWFGFAAGLVAAGCDGNWTGSPAWTVEMLGSETYTAILGSAAPSTQTADASILVDSVDDEPTDIVLATGCDAPLFGSARIAVGTACTIVLASDVASVTFVDSTVSVSMDEAAVTFEADITGWNGSAASGTVSYQFAGSAL